MKSPLKINYQNIPEACVEYISGDTTFIKNGVMESYVTDEYEQDGNQYLYFEERGVCWRNNKSIIFSGELLENVIDRNNCINYGVWDDHKTTSDKRSETHHHSQYYVIIDYLGKRIKYSESTSCSCSIIKEEGRYEYCEEGGKTFTLEKFPMNDNSFNIGLISSNVHRFKMLEQQAIKDGWIK